VHRLEATAGCALGIDVGTGSARCGVFSLEGKLLGSHSVEIQMFQPEGMPDLYEQSSEDIWRSVCTATQAALKRAAVRPEDVVGVGFDATCSLVCLDAKGDPVSVDPTSALGDHDRNIIVWLDHRAKEQAARINEGKHPALRTVGGVISLEMEVPKLLWLKENMPDKWLLGNEERWEKDEEEGFRGASTTNSADPSSRRFAHFFDLSDFLVWRATGGNSDGGDATRSLCTTVCKWNFDALPPKHSDSGGGGDGVGGGDGDGAGGLGWQGWDTSFLASVGLSDLLVEGPSIISTAATATANDEAEAGDDNFAKKKSTDVPIGSAVAAPGEPVGKGLGATAAQELGLLPGTAVGVGMIDAHAGGLGVLGALVAPVPMPGMEQEEEEASQGGGSGGVSTEEMEGRMALIAGTSCCHMLSSKEPVFVSGVWGPYFGAMLPGMFLNEGGQSTAGKLLDHVTTGHGAFEALKSLAAKAGQITAGREGTPYGFLNEHLLGMARANGLPERKVGLLTKDLHVCPDFFGNRSPLADPLMRGAVVGLGLSAGVDDLALLYLATLQALAYQTKHIIDTCEEAGHAPITSIFVTGGLVNNPLYLQAHADVTGCVLETPSESEAVLLGAAVLGARAGGAFNDVPAAMAAMNKVGSRVLPFHLECGDECDISVPSFHGCKYGVFRKMADDQQAYRDTMDCAMLD